MYSFFLTAAEIEKAKNYNLPGVKHKDFIKIYKLESESEINSMLLYFHVLIEAAHAELRDTIVRLSGAQQKASVKQREEIKVLKNKICNLKNKNKEIKATFRAMSKEIYKGIE